jgi:hypothetical protein
MFRAHFLLFFLLSSALVSGQKAELFFDDPYYKFPKAIEGDQLEHRFTFTNTGSEPLVITDYKVACVCTRVYFPLKPVMPGQTGEVRVTFDSRSKSGYHDRTISIFSNADNSPYQLRFKVLVRKKKQEVN